MLLQNSIFLRMTLDERLRRLIKKTQELITPALNKSAVLERIDQINTTFQGIPNHSHRVVETRRNRRTSPERGRRNALLRSRRRTSLPAKTKRTQLDQGSGRSSPKTVLVKNPCALAQKSVLQPQLNMLIILEAVLIILEKRAVEEDIRIAELETKASIQEKRDSVRSTIEKLDLEEEIRVRKAKVRILSASANESPSTTNHFMKK